MKHIFLSLILLSTNLLCFGQPILDSSNFGFTAPATFPIRGIWQAVVGPTGPNVTYNLNTTAPSSYDTIATNLPSASSFAANFPNADVNVAQQAIIPETFYKVDANGISISGEVKSNVTYNYTDNDLIVPFPITFGDTTTDHWSCNYNDGSATVRTGTTSTYADGYGTLVLPSGTYTNVMRLFIVQNYTDKVGNNVIRNDSIRSYWFCKPGIHFPLYRIYNRFTGGWQSNMMYYIDPIIPLSTENIKNLSFIDYYPNPSKTTLFVRFKSIKENRRIQLINMQGQTIYDVEAKDKKHSVDVSQLIAGNYQLSILVNNQRVGGEMISIQH